MHIKIAERMTQLTRDLETARASDLLELLRDEHELVCAVMGELALLKLQMHILSRTGPKL